MPPYSSRGTVLLFHGLARTRFSMLPLALLLRKHGFISRTVPYPSRKYDCRTLVERFVAPAIQRACDKATGPVHLVTHSLGGILVRLAMGDHPPDQLGRMVMLAPPNRGSELADKLQPKVLFRWFFGPVLGQLGTGPDAIWQSLPPLPIETGILAGERRAHPLWKDTLPGPSDGTVPVERTTAAGSDDHAILAVSHPFIMWKPAVWKQVLRFLRDGRFHPTGN